MFAQDFREAIRRSFNELQQFGQDTNVGRWQGVSTEGKPDLVTRELMNLTIDCSVARRPSMMPDEFELSELRSEIRPNIPWADDHFLERIAGVPTNPGEEYKNWPWWRGQDEVSMEGSQFSHTYQERFWPRVAGSSQRRKGKWPILRGIRYAYGDLNDVVDLLYREPMTRQATFPIFFPEDTGATHKGRVPCTLHYHFLMRNNRLNMWYPIRSCDAVRHFQDDLYMAVRLQLWVLDQLFERELRDERGQIWVDVIPGMLHFTAYSFHYHHGDLHHFEAKIKEFA